MPATTCCSGNYERWKRKGYEEQNSTVRSTNCTGPRKVVGFLGPAYACMNGLRAAVLTIFQRWQLVQRPDNQQQQLI